VVLPNSVVDKAPGGDTTFVVTGSDVTQSKLDIMRKKGLRNVTESELFLLIRYWGNDKMYEDKPLPVEAKPKVTKAQASPKKKSGTDDTPSSKKRGPTKEERAADIKALFE
jgi:hypothetical protein